MLGAFGNGDRRTVGIIVGIRRILVIGLNTFQAFSNGNSNRTRHNFRVYTDSLRSLSTVGLCNYGAAIDINGAVIGVGVKRKPYGRVIITAFCSQSTRTAVLPVNIKRCATHQIQGVLQVECCSFTKDQVQGFASGNTDKAFLIDGSLDHVPAR